MPGRNLLPLLYSSMLALSLAAGCSSSSTPGQAAPPNPSTIAGSAPPSTPANSGPEAGDPVTGAKSVVQKAIAVKTPSEMPELMSNETAGAIASILVMELSSRAEQESAKGSKAVVKPKLDQFLQKYGIKQPKLTAPPPDLSAKGREVFKDAVALTMDLDKATGKTTMSKSSLDMPKSPDEAKYEVVSPTRVKVTMKSEMGDKAEAIFEDGQWRLHIPDFFDQIKQAR
jgi:hypothetical protein